MFKTTLLNSSFLYSNNNELRHSNLDHLLNDLYVTIINTDTGSEFHINRRACKLIAKMQKETIATMQLHIALQLYSLKAFDFEIYKHLQHLIYESQKL